MAEPQANASGPVVKTALEYWQPILKYSDTFSVQTEIKTIMSNLGGAKSDPRELFQFAMSFLKTINPKS